MATVRPAPMRLTPAAIDRIRGLMSQAESGVEGLRLSVSSKGCSGFAYKMEFVRQPQRFDEVVEIDGARLFIDPMALMYVVGAEMDYAEDRLQAGFKVSNPNEKGRCGCGESFHV